MMRYSSPSSLISVPEYLPKRMVSPALTSSGKTLPSSLDLPLPTEMTSPCCGFSLAESGMMMPKDEDEAGGGGDDDGHGHDGMDF